jgi:hypothetical protein
MFGYSFVDTGMVETIYGVAWSGEIVYKGEVVAVVSNDGRGGCNDYVWVDRSSEEWFVSQAKALYADLFEPVDVFVDTLWGESLAPDEAVLFNDFDKDEF